MFRRAARAEGSLHDVVLPRLTRLADHSKLWLAIAALLAASGRAAGRRAAFRGLLSIAGASAAANLVLKPLSRRRRPDTSLVRIARRARRLPVSSSFPSGHAASAAAFALGVALEAPAVGAVVAPLAIGVGLSRVTTGVHYPGDVLAGAALGAASAITVRHLCTRRMRRTSDDVAVEPGALAPLPDGDGLAIVVNASSGAADAPVDAMREALPRARLVEAEGEDVLPALARTAGTARAIGVAGGDGSVSAAASEAVRDGVPLVVLPTGTLNHFARDVGVGSIDDALAAVRDGSGVRLEVGRVAGRTFLNTASIGVYPELVDERERHEARVGKWAALVLAAARVLRRTEPVPLEIDGRVRRVWMLFVGNGRFEPAGSLPRRRQRLDGGALDVRLIHADRSNARWRVLAGIVSGRLRHAGVYEEWAAERVDVRSLNGPLRIACDGETFDAPTIVAIERRGALSVYAPGSSARA